MTEQHPITPPEELVQQWIIEGCHQDYCSSTDYAIAQAARWGYEQRGAVNEAELQKARDEELDAYCEWLTTKAMAKPWETVPRPVLVTALVLELRAARRPKPPSLKDKLKEAIYSENLDEALCLVEQLDDSL